MASYGSHPSYGTQPSYGGAPENGQSPYGAGGPFGGMQQPQAPQQYNYKAPKASNGVATAAFVLALVNILLFVIPGVGAIIGLVVMLLGFIGLIKSGGLQKSGRVFSVIAMLLGLGQAGANVGGTYLIFDVAKKSFQSAQYVYDASDAVKLYQAEHGVLPDQIPLGAPTVDAWGESLAMSFSQRAAPSASGATTCSMTKPRMIWCSTRPSMRSAWMVIPNPTTARTCRSSPLSLASSVN